MPSAAERVFFWLPSSPQLLHPFGAGGVLLIGLAVPAMIFGLFFYLLLGHPATQAAQNPGPEDSSYDDSLSPAERRRTYRL
jgi:hypothetical protein